MWTGGEKRWDGSKRWACAKKELIGEGKLKVYWSFCNKEEWKWKLDHNFFSDSLLCPPSLVFHVFRHICLMYYFPLHNTLNFIAAPFSWHGNLSFSEDAPLLQLDPDTSQLIPCRPMCTVPSLAPQRSYVLGPWSGKHNKQNECKIPLEPETGSDVVPGRV